MVNPIITHSMKINNPWNDYNRILFYEVFAMNRKEWKKFCKVDKAKAHYWYNKVTKKRISKEFELLESCDVDAKVIHHLRDTEEQRKYNDEHYEMFGFEIDENGDEVFNYGKYVVFWTKEHHDEYHRCSEETRKKLSEASSGKNNAMYGKYGKDHPAYGREVTDSTRKKLSESLKGKKKSEEHIQHMREANLGKKASDETREKLRIIRNRRIVQPMFGKKHSDDTKRRMSESQKLAWSDERKLDLSKRQSGKHLSDEAKEKIGEANSGKNNGMHGVHISYKKYKEDGGTLSYREFQKVVFKDHDMYIKYVTIE